MITLETQDIEKEHLAPSNLQIDTKGFRRMKEEGQMYLTLPQTF